MDIYTPPSQFISISDSVHKKWLADLKCGKIIYIHGIFGCGKTTQVLHFAKTHFKDWVCFSANDVKFLDEITTFFAKYQKKTSKTLLIVDDLQELSNKAGQQNLFSLLSQQSKFDEKLQIMLLSRGGLPEYLVPLRITQRLTISDKSLLFLQHAELFSLFSKQEQLQHFSAQNIHKLATQCFSLTQGCSLLVQIFLQRICEKPNDEKTASLLAMRDVKYYFDTQLFDKWNVTQKNTLYSLGVSGMFSTDLAKLLLGENSESLLKNILYMDDFLEFKAPNQFYLHPTFAWYFSEKLNELEEAQRYRIYTIAAKYYENSRNFQEALRCYKSANRIDKIAELVIYLLENADGCIFAELSEQYMDMITPEMEEKNPSIIGAKAMLAAYQMNPEMSRTYLQKLKCLTEIKQNNSTDTDALSVYIRTLIASPCVTSSELKENLLMCSKYVQKNGMALKNIMPTSNSASIINGGIDLLFWIPYKTTLFPVMKKTVLVTFGIEGVGTPDAGLGEVLYEQNERVQAMASLTHALSDANFKGSIRVQYAITAIMARLLQSEGQLDTATEILSNIYEKAKLQNFTELLPNISGSIIHSSLLLQDTEKYTHWLSHNTPDEHSTFYITTRYLLLTKARIYTALGRELEALHIINSLQNYAILYHRHYMQIELLILKAIILFRRGDDWKPHLIEAATKAEPYFLVRIFADQGIALLPLWKQMSWNKETDISSKYTNTIEKELVVMAGYYPKYLQVPPAFGALTEREMEVLRLLSKGASNGQISKVLDINLGTTKFHVSNIIKKLKAENRTSATKIAQEQGLI